MAKIVVQAGDFPEGKIPVKDDKFMIPRPETFLKVEEVGFDQIAEVEIASEDSVKKLGGTLGWGAAGLLVLGPLGAAAGLLVGGRKKEVQFVAKFKDGRKILAVTDKKTFTKIQAAVF